jgi:two-component system cell cycle response regulator
MTLQPLSETHIGAQYFPAADAKTDRQACLVQIYPPSMHSDMVRLNGSQTMMGRDPSCDLCLDDVAISRNHATLEFDGETWEITDLDSRNGTYIDDQILHGRRRLCGGELIRLGSIVLKFMASLDEEAQYHAAAHKLMTRDPLTNAFNRGYLMTALEKLIPRCLESDSSLSLILIDIDHFKQINDTHGHLTGDEALRSFTDRIRRSLRTADLICRFGGEEFLVIAENTSLKDAVHIAERLRSVVASQPFETLSGLVRITCSIGVATLKPKEPTSSVDQLLAEADAFLYTAKHRGRNRVYSALNSDTQTSFSMPSRH